MQGYVIFCKPLENSNQEDKWMRRDYNDYLKVNKANPN